MKPSEIEVGKTYQNAGKGRTKRKVLEIARKYYTTPKVKYLSVESGITQGLALPSFAKWAGREVE